MKKKAFGILAASAFAIAAISAPAAAARPALETDDVLSGQACQKAGVEVLRTIVPDTNLIPFVAQNGLNVIIDGGEETNLTLPEVLAAHRADPGLFADGSLLVADLENAPATWCAK